MADPSNSVVLRGAAAAAGDPIDGEPPATLYRCHRRHESARRPGPMAARRAMAARSSYAYIELRSGTQAILVAVNKLASELSFYQRKVFRVAEHAGVTFASLPTSRPLALPLQ